MCYLFPLTPKFHPTNFFPLLFPPSSNTSCLHPKDFLTLSSAIMVLLHVFFITPTRLPSNSNLPHMLVFWCVFPLRSAENMFSFFSHHLQFAKAWEICEVSILISLRRWVEMVYCLNVPHWSGSKYRQPIHSLKSNCWLFWCEWWSVLMQFSWSGQVLVPTPKLS